MKAQRIIAVVMILGSSLLVAWTSGDIAFPAILCMLGLVGLQGRFTWGIRPERRFITPLLLLLLAVLFSIHCDLADPPSDQVAAFAWQTISRYFLASMILILFLRLREQPQPPEAAFRGRDWALAPLSPSLGLFHLASAMACGQVLLLDDRYIAFRLVELASVVLVILYALCAARDSRPAPSLTPAKCRPCFSLHAWCLGLLIVAVNFGWVGGSILYSRAESLNLLPNWLWRANISFDSAVARISQVGFSTSGRLSGVLTIMEDANPDPVLRIASDASPGYLRAMSFEQYRQSEWYDQQTAEQVDPEQSSFLGRGNLFRLSRREANREMTVRHESMRTDVMFTPLGTCSVHVPLSYLLRDDAGIIKPSQGRANLSYRLTYTTSPGGEPPRGNQLRQLLDLPTRELDPRIYQLAKRIFRDCKTTGEKIEAVTRYFHTYYTYALGLEVPIDRDPLTYFLLEASSGYCEYFASGAAILLRMVNVPTRYVTGFLVTEREDEKSWIARNMDAHAWVEAWDEENHAWTIVEATSQEDLAENSLSDAWLANESRTRLLLAQLVQAVYDYGLLGVLGWLFDVYSFQTAVQVSLAFLAAAVGLALLRRYHKSHRAKSSKAARSPELVALHKMLAAMDRKAGSAGARRRPQETLHVFAERIRHGSLVARSASANPSGDPGFADWYLAYAGLRYCKTIGPDRIAELQQLAQKLWSTS